MILHTVIACEDIFFDFKESESEHKENRPRSTDPGDYLNELKLRDEIDLKANTKLDKI